MQQTTTEDALLTPEQVSEMMGITPKTLRQWNQSHRHRHLLAPIRFTHKLVRYERRNVLAFIEKCRSTY
ncbi:DNA-binding protein [Zobellella denitrificans]|uniref:helix-turn-helix domain-containing protein n=1 Tax=Zobellella denitrificans TaxID=347534 RepID=UPI000B8C558F|nr:helix-turn-helix domain-containing protein [Zobellella denitrificans]OXS14911.1 DNA-binding protein [Zobellella denitrificans]